MLQLNSENYYSSEADHQYMSYSQYKNWRKCEAMALAKTKGLWKDEPSKAMLVGSYVDAAIEGEESLAKFRAKNPEIFLKDGKTLKSEFAHAEKMIEVLNNDPLVRLAFNGDKQVIATAELFGCMWKSKFDCFNLNEWILTELKKARELFEKIWDEESRLKVNFIDYYGYVGQVAIYSEIARIFFKKDTWPEPYLVVITSQDPPDKAVITFNQERLADELEQIRNAMPRILEVKSSVAEPTRCEKCNYCRATKKLNRVMQYDELYGFSA